MKNFLKNNDILKRLKRPITLEESLITIIIVVIIISLIYVIFYPEKLVAIALLQVIIMASSVVFASRQAKATEKSIEAASRPHVSVGIIPLKNDSYESALSNTSIVLKNLSRFPAFVWTKVELDIEGKKDKRYNEWTVQKSFCSPSPTAVWELDPHQIIIAPFFDKTILEHKEEYYNAEKDEDKLNINIKIYLSDIRELPKNPKWIELTAYSFRKGTRQWLKNNLGVPYAF